MYISRNFYHTIRELHDSIFNCPPKCINTIETWIWMPLDLNAAIIRNIGLETKQRIIKL
jgi:hypothetical protein